MTWNAYSSIAASIILATSLQAQTPSVGDVALKVQSLEAALEKSPNDRGTRVALIRLYLSSSATLEPAKIIEARRKHILWLVNNSPQDPVFLSSAATIDAVSPPLADPDGFRTVSAAWRSHLALPNVSVVVLRNAAFFFRLADKALAIDLFERSLTIDPSNRESAGLLGAQYALAILGVTMMDRNGLPVGADPDEARSELSKKARQSLQASGSIEVLTSAGYLISFQGGYLRRLNRLEFDSDVLAESVLVRAVALDPNNPRAIGPLAQHYQLRATRTRDAQEKAALWRAASKQFETTIENLQDAVERFSLMTELARAQMEAGDIQAAQKTAQQTLVMTESQKSHWNYGNALHRSNVVLGTAALRAGATEKAKDYLLAAGRTPGSPTLNSFGPNMALAQEFLLNGERATVIEFLRLCEGFWKTGGVKLAEWIATIEGGGTPNFGANLMY
jgi:tetratricopeptide (TPR) repeat protein